MSYHYSNIGNFWQNSKSNWNEISVNSGFFPSAGQCPITKTVLQAPGPIFFTISLLQFQGIPYDFVEFTELFVPVLCQPALSQAIAVLFTPISQAITLPSTGENRLQAPGYGSIETLPCMAIYGYGHVVPIR